ncbi:hypothetical protein RJT34_29215 [Clitoria ternatea]|uniref:Uncharacterized protein n=1 Tax=Clitoria ternatea TaxID=43366 RepID=A0AAN9FE41_CLITE
MKFLFQCPCCSCFCFMKPKKGKAKVKQVKEVKEEKIEAKIEEKSTKFRGSELSRTEILLSFVTASPLLYAVET